MRRWWKLLFLVVALAASLPALAHVSAWLDRDRVAPGDTVRLTLERDGQGGGDPDLAPLKNDFDILGQSSGSSVQIINGHMSSRRQLVLTLSPHHAGNLAVPSLAWDGERTPALLLMVGGQGSAANGATADAGTPRVFLETTVAPKQPYVQAAVTVTVRLHTAEPLYQASLDLPQSGDALVQQLGDDRRSSETRNGRDYRVIERRYLVFPQHSGALKLDGAVLDAQVADHSAQDPSGGDPFGSIFGRDPFGGTVTRPLRLHGAPIALQVRARPAAAGGGDWLPAQKLTLSAQWTPGKGIHAGDPLTLHLTLRAEGLTAAQLPDLGARIAPPAGLRAYPDKAQLDTDTKGDTVVGTRTQDIAFIADRAGPVTIPALHLSWWDTGADAPREATLAARTVDFLPAPGTASPAAAQPAPPVSLAPSRTSPATGPAPAIAATAPGTAPRFAAVWPWLSLALALLWLATLAAWWWSRRARAPAKPAAARVPVRRGGDAAASTAAEARAAFQRACRENDAPAARRQLLAWWRAERGGGNGDKAGAAAMDGAAGLAAVSRAVDDASLRALLRELDRACYGGGEWHGAALAAALQRLPTASSPVPAGAGPGLPGLYA